MGIEQHIVSRMHFHANFAGEVAAVEIAVFKRAVRQPVREIKRAGAGGKRTKIAELARFIFVPQPGDHGNERREFVLAMGISGERADFLGVGRRHRKAGAETSGEIGLVNFVEILFAVIKPADPVERAGFAGKPQLMRHDIGGGLKVNAGAAKGQRVEIVKLLAVQRFDGADISEGRFAERRVQGYVCAPAFIVAKRMRILRNASERSEVGGRAIAGFTARMGERAEC